MEVQTPLLSPAVIPEPTIDSFRTRYEGAGGPAELFLLPSPELWMKELIADTGASLYQITPAFRNRDAAGAWHNPEFTMLEWYTVGADYFDAASRTEELLQSLAENTELMLQMPSELGDAFRAPIRRISVRKAFSDFAGVDLGDCTDATPLLAALGLRSPERQTPSVQNGEDWEALFHRVLIERVEPALAKLPAVMLFDYPDRIRTTAALRGGGPYCRRWELYLTGVEIANCYTEETSHRRLSQLFTESKQSEPGPTTAAKFGPPEARWFLEKVADRLPPCAGVALGLDRLLAVMLGRESIEGVIFSPLRDILNRYRQTNNEEPKE